MILEREILAWNNDIGLTTDLLEVKELDQSNFPKLIFQDFMNQLKLPKLKIGFETGSIQLIELEPLGLEMFDETVKHKIDLKQSLNGTDVILYYLLTQLLSTEFDPNHIYTNNHEIAEVYFSSQIPFSNLNKDRALPSLVKKVLKKSSSIQVKLVLNRFFVLMGRTYQEKLILFLTYLDTRYKFKMNKSKFLDSTIGDSKMKEFEIEMRKKINKYV